MADRQDGLVFLEPAAAGLAAADVAYQTAVNTARNSADLVLGTAGDTGPIPGNIASMTS